MRPIKKSSPGEVVVYMDSQGEYVRHVVQEDYPNYGDAKMPMIGDVGKYCSYCESPRDADALAVEHLAARANGGSETAWNNFLLSCTVCNSCKGTTVIDEEYHWPHVNNTFLSFVYDKTGRVTVNPNIPPLSQDKARKLLELTHLERFPNTQNPPSAKDYRWYRRYETWNIATRCKMLYLEGNIDENDIICCAKDKGHWSIWFTVFTGIDAILLRLITDFPGTSEECFDPNNHYAPKEKNAGCEDPV